MDKDYFAVYEHVVKFMVDQHVFCEECVYQSDRVMENAYEFIGGLFQLVEHDQRVKALSEDD